MAQDKSTRSGFDPENPYALTPVEQQVVDLLISGLTGAEIGDLLNIDRREVALRRAAAMRKYGARNGLHLAHLIEITRSYERIATMMNSAHELSRSAVARLGKAA